MVSDSCLSRFPVRAKVYTVGVDTRNIPFRMPAFWKKYVPAGNLFCSVGCSSVSRGHTTTPMILGNYEMHTGLVPLANSTAPCVLFSLWPLAEAHICELLSPTAIDFQP